MERSENALAAEVFDQFCTAGTLKSILNYHRQLCDLLHIRPTSVNQFYPKLKAKLRSWRAQALWNKFDKRASHKCYNRGKACTNIRVLVIGAGPCGLRTAIEAQLLGAKVVVIEKRDRITRNNVLHLWPFVIHDLKALGAKKFFGRFCAGAIDHISIRQLQCILLKVALILGVEIHEGVGFESVIPPPDDQADERVGWRACTSPPDHPVSQYEFNALIGADGKRNTLDGFKRKEFRGKLAIAITANFINRHTEAEARVEEISGVAFIFNQKFFKELYASTGIDLENIVYYKDDTHYFVMTAKKHSLIDKGVIVSDYSDTAKLLSPENVDKTALMEYAREAADFSTGCRLPQLEFAVNHYGQPDVAMFDFTSMYAAENASRFIERRGHRLYVTLVGDSLLEPFWPTGSGCARGFLSSMDACWALRSWGLGAHPLEVVAERESIYRLLAQTTPENLHRDLQAYTLDPCTRYPNLNTRSVLPIQMKNQLDTDDPNEIDQFFKAPKNTAAPNNDAPKKRKRREAVVHADTLLHWLQRQVALCDEVAIENVTSSFKDGMALCAILNRYRPHLLDFASLDREEVAKNNQLAFDILEKELAIPPVMTGEEMAECDVPDKLAMLSYLSQVYEAFRGEIPHIKHPKMEETEEGKDEAVKAQLTRIRTLAQMSPHQKLSLLGKLANRPSRKRRSHLNSDRLNRASLDGKSGGNGEEFSGRVKDIEAKLRGTHTDKKPKDLLRAIGKIEKTDWNVKQIEQKIEENKMGRGSSKRSEKVPKWSKEQFEDKFTAVERKLRARSNRADDNKYNDIDITMRKIDKKVKEGFSLEQGKVSAMAEHLAKIHRQPEPVVTPTGKQATVMMPSQGASELCHFCNKRVYLMERLSAEGRFFHRGCFRCQYCSTSLRLGNYAFDREGKYGHKFFCVQHFGLQGATANRRREEVKPMVTTVPKTPVTPSLQSKEVVDMGSTPERVEFENSTCLEDEVEEDEFTDRNFGLSTTDVSETEGSDSSSESDGFAEAEDGGLDPDLETLRLAKDWTRRYASYSSDSQDESDTEMEDDEEDDDKKKDQEGSDSGSETEGARGTIRRSDRAQRLGRMQNSAGSSSESIHNPQIPPSKSFSIIREMRTDRSMAWARSGLYDSRRGVSKVRKSRTATSNASPLKTIESKKIKPLKEWSQYQFQSAEATNDAAFCAHNDVPSYLNSEMPPPSVGYQEPPTRSFTGTQYRTAATANNPSPTVTTAIQAVQNTVFSVVQPFTSAVDLTEKITQNAVCTVTPMLEQAEVNVVLTAGEQMPVSKKSKGGASVFKEQSSNACGSPDNIPVVDSTAELKPKIDPTVTQPLKPMLEMDKPSGIVAVCNQPSLKSPKLVSESVRFDLKRIRGASDVETTSSNPIIINNDSKVCSVSTPIDLERKLDSKDIQEGTPKESPSSIRRRSQQTFRDLLDQYSPHKYYDSIMNARESRNSITSPLELVMKCQQHPSGARVSGTTPSGEPERASCRSDDTRQHFEQEGKAVQGSSLAEQNAKHRCKTLIEATQPTPAPFTKDYQSEKSHEKSSVSRIPVRDHINISRQQFFSQHFEGTKFSLVQEPHLKEVQQSHDQIVKGSSVDTSKSISDNNGCVRKASVAYLSNICAPSSLSETGVASLEPGTSPNDVPEGSADPNSVDASSLEITSPPPQLGLAKTNDRSPVFKSRFLKRRSSSPAADCISATPPSDNSPSQDLPPFAMPKPFKSRFLKSNSSAASSEASESMVNLITATSKPSSDENASLNSVLNLRPPPFKSRFLKSSGSLSSNNSDSSPDVAAEKGSVSKTHVSCNTGSSMHSSLISKNTLHHPGVSNFKQKPQECSNFPEEQSVTAIPDYLIPLKGMPTSCPSQPPSHISSKPVLGTTQGCGPINNSHKNDINSTEPVLSKITETHYVPSYPLPAKMITADAISEVRNACNNQSEATHGIRTLTFRNEQLPVVTAPARVHDSSVTLSPKSEECSVTCNQDVIYPANKTKALENHSKISYVDSNPKKTTSISGLPSSEGRAKIQCSPNLCPPRTEKTNDHCSQLYVTQTPDLSNSNTNKSPVESVHSNKSKENVSKTLNSSGESITVKFPKAAIFKIGDTRKSVVSSEKNLNISALETNSCQNKVSVISSSQGIENPPLCKPTSVKIQKNSTPEPAASQPRLPDTTHYFNNNKKQITEACTAVPQPAGMTRKSPDHTVCNKCTSLTSKYDCEAHSVPANSSNILEPAQAVHKSGSKSPRIPSSRCENDPTDNVMLERDSVVELLNQAEPCKSGESNPTPNTRLDRIKLSSPVAPVGVSSAPSSNITIKLPKSAIFRIPFNTPEQNVSSKEKITNLLSPHCVGTDPSVELPRQVKARPVEDLTSRSGSSNKDKFHSRNLEVFEQNTSAPLTSASANFDSKHQSLPSSSSITIKLPKAAIFRTPFKASETDGLVGRKPASQPPAFNGVAVAENSTRVAEQIKQVKYCPQPSVDQLNPTPKTSSNQGVGSVRSVVKTTCDTRDQSVPSSSSVTVEHPKSAIFRTPSSTPKPATSCNPPPSPAAVPQRSLIAEKSKPVDGQSSLPSTTSPSGGTSGLGTTPKDYNLSSNVAEKDSTTTYLPSISSDVKVSVSADAPSNRTITVVMKVPKKKIQQLKSQLTPNSNTMEPHTQYPT